MAKASQKRLYSWQKNSSKLPFHLPFNSLFTDFIALIVKQNTRTTSQKSDCGPWQKKSISLPYFSTITCTPNCFQPTNITLTKISGILPETLGLTAWRKADPYTNCILNKVLSPHLNMFTIFIFPVFILTTFVGLMLMIVETPTKMLFIPLHMQKKRRKSFLREICLLRKKKPLS